MAEEISYFEWSPEMWAGVLRDFIIAVIILVFLNQPLRSRDDIDSYIRFVI